MTIDDAAWVWGANRGAKQHLFRKPMTHPSSLCGKAHGGDSGGVNERSKRPRCAACARLHELAGKRVTA